MATMTISLPETMKHWIEDRVRSGDYASASDYVRDAVRRDKEFRTVFEPISAQELAEKLKRSRQSGISQKNIDDLFEDARRKFEQWRL